MKLLFFILICLLTLFNCNPKHYLNSKQNTAHESPFRQENLIPWSIVAFDGKERNYLERVEMIKSLGYSRYAYGGRPQHFETMKEEIIAARKADIDISAVWLYLNLSKDKPGVLREGSEMVFDALQETDLNTQIWVGLDPLHYDELSDEASFRQTLAMIDYLSERAAGLGCKIALYNHGGWYGRPQNQVRIIKSLAQYDIGVVLNFHHAHDELDQFSENLKTVMPYLWCVTLNGMRKDGPKILTIGQGDLEQEMIEKVLELDYNGPFALLGHVRGGDPAVILEENRKGLMDLFANH